jgi:ferredoxin
MSESVYINLWKKLHENFQTAPTDPDGNPQPSFIKHLELCYTPEEAEILQHMDRPGRFTSTTDLAGRAGKPLEYVENILDNVHKKNGLMGMGNIYMLPLMPLLFNRHMFYPEVKPGDLEAAELYQDYFITDKYHRYYESSKKGTPVFRTIPVEMSIESQQRVLPAEEAHEFILNHASEEIVLAPCPCRTRTEKMGVRECADKFPIGSCIHLGPNALHMEMIGLGKRVTRQEAIEYFDTMQEKGLVGQTDNCMTDSTIICLCCGCCCSQLRGRTRWDNMSAILPSNFLPEAGDDCIGCGLCTERCMLRALTLDEETGRPKVDPDKCIGCGVCTLTCPQETLVLHRYERSRPFNTGRELIKTIALENRE